MLWRHCRLSQAIVHQSYPALTASKAAHARLQSTNGAMLVHIHKLEQLQSLLDENMYVVVDFYADWCPPCKAIAPLYEQLSQRLAIHKYLAFAKVNVDHAQPVAVRYNITSMPTFLFFKNGNRVAAEGAHEIKGANPKMLELAVAKLGRLAKEKAAAAETDKGS